jgi:hypothetical protein
MKVERVIRKDRQKRKREGRRDEEESRGLGSGEGWMAKMKIAAKNSEEIGFQ